MFQLVTINTINTMPIATSKQFNILGNASAQKAIFVTRYFLINDHQTYR
jgi:hypothetical protein